LPSSDVKIDAGLTFTCWLKSGTAE